MGLFRWVVLGGVWRVGRGDFDALVVLALMGFRCGFRGMGALWAIALPGGRGSVGGLWNLRRMVEGNPRTPKPGTATV